MLHMIPRLRISGPARPGLAPLIGKLERVKNPKAWGHYFRQSDIPLSERDYRLFEQAVLDHPES